MLTFETNPKTPKTDKMTFQYSVDPDKIDKAHEAGVLASQYVHVDPQMWLEQAALAGIRFELLEKRGFVTNCIDADFETAVFLEAWLDNSENGIDAVEALLRARAKDV